MKYIDYAVNDFVLDENFKQWVLAPTAENSAFWEAWLYDNPEKEPDVRQARKLILLMHFKKDHPENEDFQQVWEGIQRQVDHAQTAAYQEPRVVQMAVEPHRKTPYFWHFRTAASLAGLILVSLALWFTYDIFYRNITIATTSGEIRTLVLPDQSVVTLNANSELSYPRFWNTEIREVQLKGEAFFSITHQQDSTPFIVHTNHLDVRVLGTEFNVDEREDRTQVLLTAGKVKVGIQQGAGIEEVDMIPGELLAYSHQDNSIVKQAAAGETEAAWRSNQLIYENTTIADVIMDMERQFGFDIQVEDTAILQEEFNGVIPADNAEAFFVTIENTFDVQIIMSEKQIIIKAN